MKLSEWEGRQRFHTAMLKGVLMSLVPRGARHMACFNLLWLLWLLWPALANSSWSSLLQPRRPRRWALLETQLLLHAPKCFGDSTLRAVPEGETSSMSCSVALGMHKQTGLAVGAGHSCHAI